MKIINLANVQGADLAKTVQNDILCLLYINIYKDCLYFFYSVLEGAVNNEEDFPRGGAHPLTPLEIRQAKNEAEKDILFGVAVKYSFTCASAMPIVGLSSI